MNGHYLTFATGREYLLDAANVSKRQAQPRIVFGGLSDGGVKPPAAVTATL
jgi:hypothetical protein